MARKCESHQRECEPSSAKSSKKSTQEKVPDDSNQCGQHDGDGHSDGEDILKTISKDMVMVRTH